MECLEIINSGQSDGRECGGTMCLLSFDLTDLATTEEELMRPVPSIVLLTRKVDGMTNGQCRNYLEDYAVARVSEDETWIRA